MRKHNHTELYSSIAAPPLSNTNPYHRLKASLPFAVLLNGFSPETNTYTYIGLSGILILLIVLLVVRTIKLRRQIEHKTGELNSKITELLSKDQELEKEQLLYLTLFGNAQEGIITYQGERFITCNQRVCEFFNRPRKDFEENLLYLFSPITQPDGEGSLTKGMRIAQKSMNGEKQQFEWLFIKKTGDIFYADVTVTPFPYLGTTYSTVVIRDITERKRIEEELNKYKHMLEMLVAQKTEELNTSNKELEKSNKELLRINGVLQETISKLNTEILLKEHAQKEQEKDKEILERFINQSTDGICIIDKDGYIISWNGVQETLFGIAASEAKHKHYHIIESTLTANSAYSNSKVDLSSFKKSVQRYIETRIPIKVKVNVASTKDNTITKHLEATVFPINTSTGTYSGLITRDLTQQKMAEKANNLYSKKIEELLAINTQRNLELTNQLSAIFRNSTVQVAFFAPTNGTFEFVAHSINWQPFSEKKQNSLNGQKLYDIYSSNSLAIMESLLAECSKSKGEISREVEWVHHHKKYYINFMLWIVNQADYIDNPQIICFYFDNTEKRELELALGKREKHLNNAQSIAHIGSWEWDLSTQQVTCSQEMLKIFNLQTSSNAHPASTFTKQINAADLESLTSTLGIAIASKEEVIGATFIISPPNGGQKTLQATARITYKHGKPIYIEGTAQDITQQQQLEQSIIENEEKFRLIFNNSLDVITLIDLETNCYIDVNKCVVNYLGLPREQIVGKRREDINVWHNGEEKKAYLETLKRNERVENFNITWNVRGVPRNFLLSSEVIPINGRKVLLSISKDITELHKITLDLQESEEKFRTIFNSTNDGILVSTINFSFIDGNAALVNLLGYSKEELKGAHMLDFVPKEFHNILWNNKIVLAKHDKIPTIEFEVITKNGNRIPVEVSIATKMFNGRLHTISIVKDISYRKKAEERLLAATIEAEEGERRKLAGDLHDDVGPLLSSMNMYLSLLARKNEVKPFQEIIDNLTTILKETTAAVRAISRNISPHTLSRYGLVAALNAFLSDKKTFYKIDLIENLGTTRLPQLVELMIYRILMEAFCNTAKHANANSIQVLIHTSSNELKVLYSDNGQGFSYQQHKEQGQPGLGLASIANRVQVIGGTHSIKSEPNRGFTLKIHVPLNTTSL
ncbi:MAG: PAS domain S-box protein [Bacteroidales bacterium]|nr:PAS domain S-box protein [Bacteroidales bacterium]MBN2749877.1 PAS domain S-box protein [Bacteroidales bacterium]